MRWEDDERAWLEGRAVALTRERGERVGVGTVVRAVVRDAMRRDEVAEIAADIESAAGVAVASAAPSTVHGGAAPVPPSGAAPVRAEWEREQDVPRPPSRVRPRLEVVVARACSSGAGPLLPVELAAARGKVRAGQVRVDGRLVLDPAVLVDPGAVVVS